MQSEVKERDSSSRGTLSKRVLLGKKFIELLMPQTAARWEVRSGSHGRVTTLLTHFRERRRNGRLKFPFWLAVGHC